MTKEEIMNMKIHEQKEIVFSNGPIKVTKGLIRNSKTEWEISDFNTDTSAIVTADQVEAYCKDKSTGQHFSWKAWVTKD